VGTASPVAPEVQRAANSALLAFTGVFVLAMILIVVTGSTVIALSLMAISTLALLSYGRALKRRRENA
jgi:hypothetical protein